MEVVADHDIWVVGGGGYIGHWNGQDWQTIESPTTQTLTAVDFVSATDGWAVGDGRQILHWDGSAWQIVEPYQPRDTGPGGCSRILHDVAFANAATGWAVGEWDCEGGAGGILVRWDGQRWVDEGTHLSLLDEGLDAINVWSASDVWAVGSAYMSDSAAVWHWNGSVWERLVTPATGQLSAVSLSSLQDVWAVGTAYDNSGRWQGSQILHWDGQTWTILTPHTDLKSIVASSPENVMVGGAALAHWDGRLWTTTEVQPDTLGAIGPMEIGPDGSTWGIAGGVLMRLESVVEAEPTPATVAPVDVQSFSEIGRWGRGKLFAASISPNGQQMAIADSSGLWLYRYPELEEVGPINTQPAGDDCAKYIKQLVWSADSSRLAWLTHFSHLCIWDASTQDTQLFMDGANGIVYDFAWSPNGLYLAVLQNGLDGGLFIWDITQHTILTSFCPLVVNNECATTAVAWSPSSRWLAVSLAEDVGLGQPTAWVLEAATGKVHREFWLPQSPIGSTPSHQRPVKWSTAPGSWGGPSLSIHSLAWSPDGGYLAGLSMFGASPFLWIWNAEANTHQLTSICQANRLIWSADSTSLAYSCENGAVVVHQSGKFTSGRTVTRHASPVVSLFLSTDGNSITSIGEDASIVVANLKDGASARPQLKPAFLPSLASGAWSPDNQTLMLGGADGRLIQWDVADQAITTMFPQYLGPVVHVAWSPNGHYLASVGTENFARTDQDKALFVWNPEGKLLEYFQDATGDIAWSPDSTHIAAIAGRQVHVYNTSIWSELALMADEALYPEYVKSIAWSPDGKYLATIDYQMIYIWETTTWQVAMSFGSKGGSVVAWSPNSQWIASGGGIQSEVQLRNIVTRELRSVTGCPKNGTRLRWSPDGMHLALNGLSTCVYNVESGKVEWKSDIPMEDIAWSSDGAQLAGMNDDGYLYLWGISTGN